MLMEYGASESDLDSLEPCLEDLSDRDDSSDLRLGILENYGLEISLTCLGGFRLTEVNE